MRNAATSFLILLVSNAITLLLIYLQVPVQLFYSLIIINVLILMYLLQQYILPHMHGVKPIIPALSIWAFFFFSSFFVVSLVFSTGGIYSSFFVLLHFYALMVGFFASVIVSLFFIIISIISLLLQAQIDPRLHSLLLQDAASLILYSISYLVIVPFSYFLSQQFQIKTKVTQLLQKEAAIHNSILESINELIIITDLDLKVLSANDTVEQILGLTKHEIISRTLFDILYLRSIEGHFINASLLGIDKVIENKNSKIVSNLQLLVKNKIAPLNIKLTIKAIPDLQGNIDQLTFIISDLQTSTSSYKSIESTIKDLQTRQQALLESLKGKLITEKMAELASEVYLLQNLSKDIQLAADIQELTTSRTTNSVLDVAQFTNNLVMQHQELAHLFNTVLTFRLVNFSYADIAGHVPAGMVVSPMQLTSSFYSASLPVKWFDVLINKMLFLGLLLSLASDEHKLEVSIERVDQVLRIRMKTYLHNLVVGEEKLLFVKGYGALNAKTQLYLGSGLEGQIIKQIVDALKLKLNLKYTKDEGSLIFTLDVEKKQSHFL